MSLDYTIKDCQKLLDFLLNEFFDEHRPMKIEDFSIIGLFQSMVKNAKAITVLNENKLGDSEVPLSRTVLEQSIYFDYIFEFKKILLISTLSSLILRILVVLRINIFEKIYMHLCSISFVSLFDNNCI